jgi:hypothetical protein
MTVYNLPPLYTTNTTNAVINGPTNACCDCIGDIYVTASNTVESYFVPESLSDVKLSLPTRKQLASRVSFKPRQAYTPKPSICRSQYRG